MKKALSLLGIVAALSASGVAMPAEGTLLKGNKMAAGQNVSFEAHKALYGFDIADCWKPCGGFEDQHLYDFKVMDKNYVQDGEVQFYASVQQVLLKYEGVDDVFAFAYRVVVTPLQVYHPATGALWWAKPARGDDWVTSEIVTIVDVNGGSIGDWAPKNIPQNYSTSITLGVGTDGASISATMDIVAEDVLFVSKTRAATGYYYSKYSLNNSDVVNTGGSSVPDPSPAEAYSTCYYGFFTFQADIIDFYCDVYHKVSFYGINNQKTVSLNFDYDY
ncbi:MAG: hypothetical protein J6328_04405 [Bacilli bacterium]|nr:hypothetical protein [Bacilli bacterium]